MLCKLKLFAEQYILQCFSSQRLQVLQYNLILGRIEPCIDYIVMFVVYKNDAKLIIFNEIGL